MLSDRDINAAITFSEEINVEPYDREMLQPASIDVRLDRFFCVFNNQDFLAIDPAVNQEEMTRRVEVDPEGYFVLHPGEFVLASTYEKVTLDSRHASRFEGKSSLGRLGLITHVTAGFIDPGFSGHVTLELANLANLPIKLYPGMKIGQLCFFHLDTESMNPYGSTRTQNRYQGQQGPTPSMGYRNFHQTKL